MIKEDNKRGILKTSLDFITLQHPTFSIPKTKGQKAADSLTKWAGSWTFIILFAVF